MGGVSCAGFICSGRGSERELARDAPHVQLELEPLDGRAAREPVDAVDGGGAGGAEDLVDEEVVDGVRGVDVDGGDTARISPAPATMKVGAGVEPGAV